jgi:PDZ domain
MNFNRPLLLALLSAQLLLLGCASGYKEFYKPASQLTLDSIAARRVAAPPTIPILERVPPTDSQLVLDAYAKRGYLMIGNSFFNSGRTESEDSAIRQGQAVGADLVLIMNPTYTGSVTSRVPITTPTTTTSRSTGTATAYGPGGTATAYGSGTTTTYGSNTTYVPITINRSDFGAVFFVKQRFGLGLFTRDLSDSERQELQSNKGVVVRLVVDASPAFDADVLVGDTVLSIDGLAVSGMQGFSNLLHQRDGKMVTLTLLRRGQRIEKTVQLNP